MPNSRPRIHGAAALFLVAVVAASGVAAAVVPESQLSRALRKQERLIEASPGDASLWNDLGNLLMLGRRLAEAEEAYETSLDLDPDLISARYNLALLFQETGRMARSKHALRRVLRKNPSHAWSRYYLGVAEAETGRRRAATRQFALAVRLEPDLADPHVNPHVLDNPLMAGATLRAYADTSGAQLAPRLYEDRERVVRTMVRPRQLESAIDEGEPEDEGDGGSS